MELVCVVWSDFFEQGKQLKTYIKWHEWAIYSKSNEGLYGFLPVLVFVCFHKIMLIIHNSMLNCVPL